MRTLIFLEESGNSSNQLADQLIFLEHSYLQAEECLLRNEDFSAFFHESNSVFIVEDTQLHTFKSFTTSTQNRQTNILSSFIPQQNCGHRG